MILSKKVEAALRFIQKIDIPAGLSSLEAGRAVHEKSTMHGFFQMGGMIEETAMLMQDIVEFIKTQNSSK